MDGSRMCAVAGNLQIQIACSGQATQEQRIYVRVNNRLCGMLVCVPHRLPPRVFSPYSQENMRKHGLVSLKELLAGFVAELVARG